MSETRWTPGPWFSEDENGPDSKWAKANIGVWSQARYDAALVTDGDDEADDEKWVCGIWGAIDAEDRANAHLIAAAPELYEALAAMVERYAELVNCGDCGFWDPESEDEVKASRAALRKARGEA